MKNDIFSSPAETRSGEISELSRNAEADLPRAFEHVIEANAGLLGKGIETMSLAQEETGSQQETGLVEENNSRREIGEDGFYTTRKERIDHTPVEGWEGERGESRYIPASEAAQKILKDNGLEGIEYKNGVPDFSPCAVESVEIDNMTANKYENFKQCRVKIAEKWNAEGRDGRTDWTPRDVEQWQKDNHFLIHECSDMRTCQMVPEEVHKACTHTGGRMECKLRDSNVEDPSLKGGKFDE